MISSSYIFVLSITVLFHSTCSYRIQRRQSCFGVCDGDAIVCIASSKNTPEKIMCIETETNCKGKCINNAKKYDFEGRIFERWSD